MLKRGEKIVCKYCGEESKHYAKGFCKKCYARNQRHGSPENLVQLKSKAKIERETAKSNQLKSIRENRYNPKNSKGKEFNELYKSGMTLQQIGDKYYITRERVRQILTDVSCKMV